MSKISENWRLIRSILILGSILAAVKLIFVDYTLDEEYQIVMSYRQLSGDILFGTMWEPHQTSAFACVFLMRIFMMMTGGTTGVVVFLRVCTTVIQLLLALWVYVTLCGMTEKEYAFLISCCYFNIVPKIIQIPEFSNLQLWFFTIIILSLAHYFRPIGRESARGRRIWIILAGAGMALEVLAYPADIVLFPFFLIVFLVKSREKRWRDVLLFGGTCAVCALVWLWSVLSRVTWGEFLRNLKYIVEFDLTHEFSGIREDKLLAIAMDLGTELFLLGLAFLIGALVWLFLRKKSAETAHVPFCVGVAIPAVLAAEMLQLIYWLVLQKGYEEPQIHLLTIIPITAAAWRYADSRRRLLTPCLGGAFLTLLAVLYMSDLSFFYAIPHALPGILGCLLVLVFALENTFGKERSRVWILVLLVSLTLVSIFGKGFVLRAGKTHTNTILGLGGIMREGPAAGILTNYMQAYVNNCDYEDFEAYVERGTNCMIVTNMVGTGGTSPYMFRDLSVCHFSIVDPTSYDERLLTYWKLYPEKQPDVIVVDCWYGQLMEPVDNWIMQYIENDFGYTAVEEGRYVRFYFR